jgi:hypothetical protein
VGGTLKEEPVMANQNNLHVPDELLAELKSKAAAESKTVDELAEEALRQSLEGRKWRELLAYGHERGARSGFTEERSADVVHDWREEQRR